MAYNRQYSLQEVVGFLNASEGRVRPDITSGIGPKGHAIALHTQERLNVYQRPLKHDGSAANLPAEDSIFFVDRNALASMVHEALNSGPGQKELEKLNDAHVKSARIRSVVLRQGKEFDILTVYRPKDVGEQTSFDWVSAASGDGCIVEIFVHVYKIPNSSTQALHIQTAYPNDYARTQGDLIVRAKPRPGSKHDVP